MSKRKRWVDGINGNETDREALKGKQNERQITERERGRKSSREEIKSWKRDKELKERQSDKE